ncbi:MAG: amidohydrolase family protein [Victivallaceae bacterium]
MKLLVTNARVADGTGAPLYRGQLAAENGRILAVAPHIPHFQPDHTIDAHNRILAPGLIDVHGHSELSLAAHPAGFGKASQGFTTEIAGNCGLAPFPLTDRNRSHLQHLHRQYGITLDWSSCREFRQSLASRNPQIDILPLAGHNTLRSAVVGYQKKKLSPRELNTIIDHLHQCFADGALGLSSGLIYTPGCFADRAELAALIREVAQADKIYTIHLRSEGNLLLESLRETIDLARETGLKRLQISHFKTSGQANWPKMDAAIALLEEARRDGIELGIDRYPYIESMTQLSVVAPPEWSELDDCTLEKRLQDPAEFERLVKNLNRDWSTVRLANSNAAEFTRFRGRKLLDIAAELNESPARLTARILRADCAGTNGAFAGMCEENLAKVLALDYCMCGSDESARPEDFSLGASHPRGFGSAPEFFQRLLPKLGPAGVIHRMTGLAAKHFRLTDRGLLKAGLRADLVLIEPDKFKARATFEEPHRACTGIEIVKTA